MQIYILRGKESKNRILKNSKYRGICKTDLPRPWTVALSKRTFCRKMKSRVHEISTLRKMEEVWNLEFWAKEKRDEKRKSGAHNWWPQIITSYPSFPSRPFSSLSRACGHHSSMQLVLASSHIYSITTPPMLIDRWARDTFSPPILEFQL